MNYHSLKEQLKGFIVFTLVDIRKVEPHFYRSRLNEWRKKGYIKKLRRGHYLFSDATLNEEALYLIANRLYAPSYVSFEMALSAYGLIPEGVYAVTSACGRKTARFRTPIGEFVYRKIKSELLFGYQLGTYKEQPYKIAEVEKAFLDYVYLHPNIAKKEDFYEWRFNSEAFLNMADMNKLHRYLEAFHNKQLTIRTEKILTMMKQTA